MSKRIMVDMYLTLLHHGHIRLLKWATLLGYVVVAFTTYDEVVEVENFTTKLNYADRRKIALAI